MFTSSLHTRSDDDPTSLTSVRSAVGSRPETAPTHPIWVRRIIAMAPVGAPTTAAHDRILGSPTTAPIVTETASPR